MPRTITSPGASTGTSWPASSTQRSSTPGIARPHEFTTISALSCSLVIVTVPQVSVSP